MPDTVIKATGLSKDYSGFQAVKGIDFEVLQGECFGFLGPNGAGKTTTMNMVQGYSSISGGSLSVLGMDVDRDARQIKARLGVVPQENNLDPDLSVIENLRVYARYFDIPKKEALERAAKLLEFVALAERSAEHVQRLSGGMKRRLMVARALINDPELIILDEPTTGLDPQARHLLWQKLGQLKSEGRTMLMTTHYMEEAAVLCDRLVIMDRGTILDEGTPAALIRKHVRGDVVELKLGDEGPERIAGCLQGIEYDSELSAGVLYVYTDDAQAVLDKAACLANGGFTHRRATLEDVFLKLTGRELKEW